MDGDRGKRRLWVHAAAGGLSGALTDTLLHPLDTLSTRLKVVDRPGALVRTAVSIARREGFRAYYRGLSASIVMGPPSSALYFLAYETGLRGGRDLGAPGWAQYMAAGAAAELASSVVHTPQDVVKNRMQLGRDPERATRGLVKGNTNFRNALQAAVGIARASGPAALYTGWRATLLTDAAFGALQFLIYEEGKEWYRARARRRGGASSGREGPGDGGSTWSLLVDEDERGSDIPPQVILGLGCVAGGAAAWATNPLEVVCTRLMTQAGSGRTAQYAGIADCFVQVLRAGGRRALWAGVLPRMLYLIPYTSLHLGIYEVCKRAWSAERGALRS